jgi:hypothetical protein
MNADLMITIAFCLYVLVGSFAVGVLVAKSTRDDKAKEADAQRRMQAGCRPEYPSKKRSRATRSGERPAAVWLGPEKDRK